jgi:general stress protein CsbA
MWLISLSHPLLPKMPEMGISITELAMYVKIKLSAVATLFASAKLDHTWSMWIMLVHSKLQMEVSSHREL